MSESPAGPSLRGVNDARIVARHGRAMRRAAGIGFALASYAMALLALLAFFDALAGTLMLPFGGFDHGPVWPVREALLVDVALVAAFGLSHSLMARDWFKVRWTRVVPRALERSVYVLTAACLLLLLVWQWRPVPGTLWSAPHEGAALLIECAFLAGLLLAAVSTFQISHRSLFGLARPFARPFARPARDGGDAGDSGDARDEFRTPLLYRYVRHPMQLGILVALWATPVLTVGRALLAAALSAYVLIGLRFEERALLRAFGDGYAAYRRRVPMLVPRPSVRRVLVAASVLASAVIVTGAAGARTAVRLETFRHAGFERRHRTVLPPVDGARPVLVVLHGRGQDGALTRRLVGAEIEAFAARAGWIVVYPDGHERSWNDCRASLAYPAHLAAVPDTWFLREMVRRLARDHGADTSRVIVLGYSNGGHLAHRLAAEAPGLVRGVAVFGANLPALDRERCVGSAPTLFVAGRRDRVNPWAGGTVQLPTGAPAGDVLSADASAERARGAAAAPASTGATSHVPPLVPDWLGHELPAAIGRGPTIVASSRPDVLRTALEFLATTIR